MTALLFALVDAVLENGVLYARFLSDTSPRDEATAHWEARHEALIQRLGVWRSIWPMRGGECK